MPIERSIAGFGVETGEVDGGGRSRRMKVDDQKHEQRAADP